MVTKKSQWEGLNYTSAFYHLSTAVTVGLVQTQLTVNETVGTVAVDVELTTGVLQDDVNIDVNISSIDGTARGQ